MTYGNHMNQDESQNGIVKYGTLVIYRSADCKTFEPVKPEDVPAWVQAPDVVAHMVDGEAVHNDGEPESPYYIAKRVLTDEDESDLMKAYAKRQRRNRLRVVH